VTTATAAIVVVHLYGRPADVVPLLAHRLPVIEDAAQAHGALHRITGAAAVYSFYPTKNVGGIGDGGAVLSTDATLAAMVRRLRAHGMAEQYVHTEISQNHRLSELEAAWLRLQLPDLRAGNTRRAAIAQCYRTAAPRLCWHAEHPDHVVHQCVLRASDRDAARAMLAARGVASAVHYPLAITQQPAYRHLDGPPCPRAEAWAASCVSLPCFPELTDDEVGAVAAALEALAA
jgi:dTDP-3-amino-2,3,6-trideoxy-4-keto-D-glucose/dTDP-3-amino-3,4,6-trideoxy-alpha-D-glucose/dTDP-2,6-dideoxy-D-kanosamine transaminase